MAIRFLSTQEQTRHDRPSNYSHNVWEFQCDCGVIKPIRVAHVVAGKTMSCGCLKKISKSRHLLTDLQLVKRQLASQYHFGAKTRAYEIELTQDEIWNVSQNDCVYCGVSPSTEIHPQNRTTTYYYNGLDRVNNTVGYIRSNIVPCCFLCNRMKREMSVDEFLLHIQKICKYISNIQASA